MPADQSEAAVGNLGVPASAVAIILHRIDRRGVLISCKIVSFRNQAAAIDTVLRRAQISGLVRVGGPLPYHFADLLDADGNVVQNVALDAASYRALKTRWMRTQVEHAA